ncbi:MAG: hypothetical protein WB948_01285 [Desulfobaccales bacterium]
MQIVTYSLPDRGKKIKVTESSFPQLHLALDSLGNNLMAMLLLTNLALTALQEGGNLDQAQQNLQEALQAGDCAKNLMRTVLNSQKYSYIDS